PFSTGGRLRRSSRSRSIWPRTARAVARSSMTGASTMPSGGDLVILPGDAMVPLVRAVAALADAGVGRYAIVGGVAVAARLNQAHRATADVDTVVDETTPP